MIRALIGISTDPVSRKSNTNVARMTTATAPGASAASAAGEVDQPRGRPGDPGRVVRRVAADRFDDRPRLGRSGVGVLHVHREGRVALADGGRRRHQSHAGVHRDLRGQRRHLLRRGLPDHLDGRDAQRRVVLGQGVEELPVGRARRQQVHPGIAHLQPEGGQREQSQHRDDPDDDQPRMALGAAREPGEEALVGRHVAEPGHQLLEAGKRLSAPGVISRGSPARSGRAPASARRAGRRSPRSPRRRRSPGGSGRGTAAGR